MIILSDSEDRFHNLTTPGSYEWTYFDGLSEDAEWAFVAIWFRGCPMSPYYTAAIDRYLRNPKMPPPRPEDYCAFSFSLYHRGRSVFRILEELPARRFSTAPGTADARLGTNAVRGETSRNGSASYMLYIDAKSGPGGSRVVGDIEMTSRGQNLAGLGERYSGPSGDSRESHSSDAHFWVPAALDSTFTARLDLWRLARSTRKARFHGRAYHDRNFGAGPLHHLRADWHWGRVHSGRHALVYFAVTPDEPGHSPFRHLLLLDEGRLLHHAADFELGESPRKSHWAGLSHAKETSGKSQDGLSFSSVARQGLDSGPFYHRFLSDIHVAGDGIMPVDAPGITEFLRPSRLGVAAFRPFVKFRVKRKKG